MSISTEIPQLTSTITTVNSPPGKLYFSGWSDWTRSLNYNAIEKSVFDANGILTKTSFANEYESRTITGTVDRIDVTYGDGVSGNISLDFADDILMTDLYFATGVLPTITFNSIAANIDLGIDGDVTTTSTVGGGNEVFYTYTIQPNTLTETGEGVHLVLNGKWALATIGNSGASLEVRVGGTDVATIGPGVTADLTPWQVDLWVYYISSTVVRCVGYINYCDSTAVTQSSTAFYSNVSAAPTGSIAVALHCTDYYGLAANLLQKYCSYINYEKAG